MHQNFIPISFKGLAMEQYAYEAAGQGSMDEDQEDNIRLSKVWYASKTLPYKQVIQLQIRYISQLDPSWLPDEMTNILACTQGHTRFFYKILV